jgi:hypothetical protein
MKLIYYDTEFTDLAMDCRLVSIGLVDETGQRSFYAELSDTYEPQHLSEFVRAAVMPLLQGGEATMPLHELTLRLGNWLESFGESVVLASDSFWDTGWIGEIFATPGTWPANLAPPQVLRFADDEERLRFNRLEMQARLEHGLRFHHALDDARAIQMAVQGLARPD